MESDQNRLRPASETVFDCPHVETRLRWKTIANGSRQCAPQCLACGARTGNPVRHELAIAKGVRETWDDELVERVARERRLVLDEKRVAFQESRISQDHEFWLRYNAAINSDRWKNQIRPAVMKRCGGICEGCGLARAVQVHHRTYVNLGAEFLWELAAVCLECHQRVHPHRDFGRNGR